MEGDLVVGTGYSACTFSHLIVRETADEVAVWIVGDLPESGADLDPRSAMDICSRSFGYEAGDVGLSIIRVPLEQPLGDRRYD